MKEPKCSVGEKKREGDYGEKGEEDVHTNDTGLYLSVFEEITTNKSLLNFHSKFYIYLE